MAVEGFAEALGVEGRVTQAIDQIGNDPRRDATGVLLEEPVETAAADERGEGVHVADVDEDGAVGATASATTGSPKAPNTAAAPVSIRVTPGDRLLDGFHAGHSGRWGRVDHATQIPAGGEQALQVLEADLVVAGAGTKSMILDGDRHALRHRHAERRQRRCERRRDRRLRSR